MYPPGIYFQIDVATAGRLFFFFSVLRRCGVAACGMCQVHSRFIAFVSGHQQPAAHTRTASVLLAHDALYSHSQQRSVGRPTKPTARHRRVSGRCQREAHGCAHQVRGVFAVVCAHCLVCNFNRARSGMSVVVCVFSNAVLVGIACLAAATVL